MNGVVKRFAQVKGREAQKRFMASLQEPEKRRLAKANPSAAWAEIERLQDEIERDLRGIGVLK
jgi:hypothetical protein